MNDVASAWLMTTLTDSPFYIALVQTASTLPMFLLGLPSGALADTFDRRKYFLLMQCWVALVGTISAMVVLAEKVTPSLLLFLTFANGIGLAMRLPVFAAIVPGLVPRSELALALALNGIATNASRILGPVIAGAIIASLGSAYVFALNALLSVACCVLLFRWKYEHKPSALGREPLKSAIRVGIQFTLQSTRLKAILIQISIFFFHSTSLLALLPLVARGLGNSNAGTYTILLASMGGGAIFAATLLPRMRVSFSRDKLVLMGALMQSGATVAVAIAPHVTLAATGMFFAGMAWITTANSLSVSAQLCLPDWVRARGMAMFQMSIMGASAAGAAVWGQAAAVWTTPVSLCMAALSGAVATLVVTWRKMDLPGEEDLSPSHEVPVPLVESPPQKAQILVSVEYLIDPARDNDFQQVMEESRRHRLRQGALRWELLYDVAVPGRYIEQVIDESWTEHLRRFDRVTKSDIKLRDKKQSFHIGSAQPRISRYKISGQ